MMGQELLAQVTVVVPAYNAEHTLAETLESVRANISPARIIVVDDGSTDSTATIARACGVDLIQQANLGAADARAVGIRAVETKYLIALDSDDQLAEGIVRALVQLDANRDAAVCGGAIAVIDADGNVIRVGKTPVASLGVQELLLEPMSPWPPCAAVWRTESLRRANELRIAPLSPRYAEDYELLIRVAMIGDVISVPSVTANYRSFGGKSTNNALASLQSAEAIRLYYAEHLGLITAPSSPTKLRRLAAWRWFRGRQAATGLTRASWDVVKRPRLAVDVGFSLLERARKMVNPRRRHE